MNTSNISVDSLVEKLEKTSLPKTSGVSFAGRGLKLETAQDAEEIVQAIESCPSLDYLDLQGNSLGVKAAERIAQALSTRGELKIAMWRDMFTSRSKDEIPEALKFLCKGLITAKVKLEVLDLSDNASGPIGMNGVQELFKSNVCFGLKELWLNNMGLGVSGAKMLTASLNELLRNCAAAGCSLDLKLFVAGRNRLENHGTIALSTFFSRITTLEKYSTPQNGIYEEGIDALVKVFRANNKIKEINLNDNTIGVQGAVALGKVLTELHELVVLDVGDCLLTTRGCVSICSGLKDGSKKLEKVNLSFNEIKAVGGLELLEALRDKPCIKSISINGNEFGEEGVTSLKDKASELGKLSALASLSEDEGSGSDDEGAQERQEGAGDSSEVEDEEDDDEDDDDDDDELLDDEDDDSEDESEEIDPYNEPPVSSGISPLRRGMETQLTSAVQFNENSTGQNLLGLGEKRAELLIQDVKGKPEHAQVDALIATIMRVSSLTREFNFDVANASLACTEALYRELSNMGSTKNCLSQINNALPVYLGLIKCEEKTDKRRFNYEGCTYAAENAMRKGILPQTTKDILDMCLKLSRKAGVK